MRRTYARFECLWHVCSIFFKIVRTCPTRFGKQAEKAHSWDRACSIQSTQLANCVPKCKAHKPNWARTVHSPQLADLEHDLKEVISSMLISAAEHIEVSLHVWLKIMFTSLRPRAACPVCLLIKSAEALGS
eukprot:1161052-Pelagomonas_calceolata.AAC.3